MTIYPEIDVTNDTKYCQVSTHLRLKGDDGKYYLKRIEASYYYGKFDAVKNALESIVRKFQTELYLIQLVCKVIPGSIEFKLDSNQEDESNRLHRLYLIK